MSEQTYRGTHRHRAPLGWHPPRIKPETNGDAGMPPGEFEPTEPFTPTFTDELPVITGGPSAEPVAVPVQLADTSGEYIKRWTFALVVAGVWVVAAGIGLALYYWWFHSIDKTPAVFVVLVYLVVCIVAALVAAMAPQRPLISVLGIALMSAPFASTAAAAVLYGMYFCEHASRCLVGILPY